MKLTEIIPDDMPAWAIKAMADGQLFNRTFERLRATEWIRVEDRLPLYEQDMDGENYKDMDVIIFEGGIVRYGYFIAGNSAKYWSKFDRSGVTHWMPLPEPPTDAS